MDRFTGNIEAVRAGAMLVACRLAGLSALEHIMQAPVGQAVNLPEGYAPHQLWRFQLPHTLA
jgi:hypothetical protein